ncbi:MAG: hypothetical protein JNL10_05605 [Verrucomicrobiales bacterium]|nr:hypothetical protein [Verrucomicrobiales bacterium]
MSIEAQIQAWRERLQATGTITADSLDELESSLREAMVVHMEHGLSPQAAYDTAQLRLGSASELAREFAKVDSSALIRSRIGWMVAGSTVLALWYALGGFVAMAVRHVEYWIRFPGQNPREDPLAAFEFWRHTSIAGLAAELAAVGCLGLCLHHRSVRPILRRCLERLQSDSRIQAGVLFVGTVIAAGLHFAFRPPPFVFTGPIPESVTNSAPTPLDILGFAALPAAFLLLLCAFIWKRSFRTQTRREQLWERTQQLARRHTLAWMGFGILGFEILSLWVAAIGMLVLTLLERAIDASGFAPILDPPTIQMVELLGMTPAMIGAAILALRLTRPIIPSLNRSRILGLIQSSPVAILLSWILMLGSFVALPWAELYVIFLSVRWMPSTHQHWDLSSFGILLHPFVFAMIAVPMWFTSRKNPRKSVAHQLV